MCLITILNETSSNSSNLYWNDVDIVTLFPESGTTMTLLSFDMRGNDIYVVLIKILTETSSILSNVH